MAESFRQRFMREAGEHPYAWATGLGLPKDLVTAVVRGKEDYQPIRRTLDKLAHATGKSVQWWLSGEEAMRPEAATNSLGQGAAPYSRSHSATTNVVGSVVAGTSRIEPALLEIAARALREWEDARHIKVAEDRRSAIIAILYNDLIEAEAQGVEPNDVAKSGLG